MFVGYLTNTEALQIITVERDEAQPSAEVQMFGCSVCPSIYSLREVAELTPTDKQASETSARTP